MVKSACIEKITCPDCSVQPNTHLQTYLNVDEALGMEWFTSFCHGSCHEQKGDPYGEKVAPKAVIKTPAQLQEETNDIKECPVFNPVGGYRGVPAEHYKSFSVRLLLSEYDGVSPVGIAFPYSDYGVLSGWKARMFKLASNGKKVMFAIGRTADADPFGMARALALGGDVLFMTEGEIDAITLDYCLTLVGDQAKYPVISLTAGGGSLGKNFDYIESRVKRKYKHIVLVLDDDEVGHLAEEAALDLWGNMCIIIKKPKGCNDPNDAVKAGKAVEMGNLALNYNK